MPDITGLGDDDDYVTIVPHFTKRETPFPAEAGAEVVARTTIDNPQWEAFQKWQAREARRKAKTGDVVLPEFVNIQVEAVENMAPSGHPVGVNGTCFIIKAGIPQRVPSYVIEVLRNAKIGMPVRDPVTQRVIRYEDRLRLPFTILPDDADFEADAA